MKRIEEQAKRLDQEYQGIAQLFHQFCQQAGGLAEQYHFFSWPDYEETPPLFAQTVTCCWNPVGCWMTHQGCCSN